MSDNTIKKQEQINPTPLKEALSERYLSYAMSTIVSRSLPDVRDGLKPVHRRLLYAMRELKLNPKSGYKKCARVVGDVIGKFHPHGEMAVYDAMVRLAQSFSSRYPLVDGQGNFGNIDGDGAAAMRYTEARVTEFAEALMQGLDENAVDFSPNYSGEYEEPVVMPAAYPNLLANGSAGIAVGMATNVPPHNIGELCDGLLHLIKKPDTEVKDLVKYVKSPDFPTGGIICEDKADIIKAYEDGKGSFKIRSKWEKEDLSYGNYQIVVTEIPYQVLKSKLIEKTAELLDAKKLPLISDIRDESTEDIRIIIEPKNRTTDPELLMEHLFKLTDFESKFNMNLNALLTDGTPKVCSLKDVFEEFINFRKDILIRRTNYRLEKIAHRLEVLGGYLIAYLNLDEVIAIIRENDEPKPILIERFQLSDVQAEAILNMKLRSLRKLEEIEIRKEDTELKSEQKELKELIASEDKIRDRISEEITFAKEQYGPKNPLGKRMSRIQGAVETSNIEVTDFIEKEPITIVLSEKGWIRSLKGHTDLKQNFNFKEGDSLKFAIHTHTTDKILFFSSSGRFYTILGDKIPGGRGYGDPLRIMFDMDDNAEIIDMFPYKENVKLFLASEKGFGFQVEIDNVVAQTKTGKIILNLTDGDKAVKSEIVNDDKDSVAVVGNNRKLLIFGLDEVPVLNRGKGVILQKYKDKKTHLSDVKLINSKTGLGWINAGRNYNVEDIRMWQGRRASVGHNPPTGFPRTNKFD